MRDKFALAKRGAWGRLIDKSATLDLGIASLGDCGSVHPADPQAGCWRKILVPYRQVRRRSGYAWTRAFPAGALAIGGFGLSRWRLRRTR